MGAEGGRLLGRARGEAQAWLNYLTFSPDPSPEVTSLIDEYRECIRRLAKVKIEDVIGKDIEAEYHFRVEHDGLKPEEVLDLPQNIEDELDGLLVSPQQHHSNGTQDQQHPWSAAVHILQELQARSTALIATRAHQS